MVNIKSINISYPSFNPDINKKKKKINICCCHINMAWSWLDLGVKNLNRFVHFHFYCNFTRSHCFFFHLVSYPIISPFFCEKGWNWITASSCDSDSVSLSCILLFSCWPWVWVRVTWRIGLKLSVELSQPMVSTSLCLFLCCRHTTRFRTWRKIWKASAAPSSVNSRSLTFTSRHSSCGPHKFTLHSGFAYAPLETEFIPVHI